MDCVRVPASELARPGGMVDPYNYMSKEWLKKKGISVQLNLFDATHVTLIDHTGTIICEARVVDTDVFHVPKQDIEKVRKEKP